MIVIIDLDLGNLYSIQNMLKKIGFGSIISNKLEDINTLTFVAIHEMGHLASGTVGHNQEFWDNFEFLLREATSIGLYKKVEYSKNPKSYCGIQITDSPIE